MNQPIHFGIWNWPSPQSSAIEQALSPREQRLYARQYRVVTTIEVAQLQLRRGCFDWRWDDIHAQYTSMNGGNGTNTPTTLRLSYFRSHRRAQVLLAGTGRFVYDWIGGGRPASTISNTDEDYPIEEMFDKDTDDGYHIEEI